MLHPAREVEVVLETSAVVMEVVSVGVTTLVVEETSVVKAALVAAVVVADMAAVGMDIMDLGMMEAILEVAEATVILAITTINLQILAHERRKLQRQKFWPLWWWRPILCQTTKPRWLWTFQQQQELWQWQRF